MVHQQELELQQELPEKIINLNYGLYWKQAKIRC